MSAREEELQKASRLESIGRNLTHLAAEGRIGPIYERREIISELASQLAIPGNNVMLLGEPGTGNGDVKRYERLSPGGIVLALFLAIGCAAFSQYGQLEERARQHYQRGDYDSAVFECAASLRLNPNYGKAQALIQDSFRAAVNSHLSKIRQLNLSSAKFRWDDMVSEYEALIKLGQVIRGMPAITDKKSKEAIRFEVTDYAQDLAEAKKKAAEAHYQEGLRLSGKEGKDIQKQAAKEFKLAEHFHPGYRDAASLYEKSKQAGIKRIAIVPFEDKSGKRDKYGALSEATVDEVVTNVMNDPSASEFLEIISRDQMERVLEEQKLGLTGLIDEQTALKVGNVLGVHEILTGKITQIVFAPERTVRKQVKEEAEVVVGREKYTDKKGKARERDVWGKVYATVTIHTKSSAASITGSYQVIDVVTAIVKRSGTFVGKADFASKWATFVGDERALSFANRSLVELSEGMAPVEEEMVGRAAHDLANSLAKSLMEYAR